MDSPNRGRRTASSVSRSGFSLLELLAVMVLAMVLLVAVGPSVYSMLNAHGLSGGIRDVSNHLVRARSEAIAKHTLTRFMVAKTWPEEGGGFSHYSIWRWNSEHSKFHRISEWGALPRGIVFEPQVPPYILKSGYALNDATSVHGEDAMNQSDATVKVDAFPGEQVVAQFVEFLPNGSARIPGGTEKKVIFVIVEGEPSEKGGDKIKRRVSDGPSPQNWAQVNLDTLTGRVRIYRP